MLASTDTFETFTYEHDGLRLSGRSLGPETSSSLPIVCLPGLTRNSRDFDAMALAIRSLDPDRRIVAFDYRGRGHSQYATGAEAYTVPAEAADILAGLDHLKIDRAVFVGTSRGTLVIHLLAMMRLEAIAAAVFNDAGPKIEAEGLRLIRDTVGVVESFPDWPSAVDALATSLGPAFPAMTRADFERMARAGYVERDGRIVGDYDPRLLEPLRTIDLENGLPELWEAFDLMKDVPLLVIRGENSTLFSASTVDAMKARHGNLESIEVPGQGHAPFLETAGLPAKIARFAGRIS
ncbi:alpha/beta fold hydrolase [Jiella marina]|uniref:alpha/beta fold hydrolase n=1 Tax=Jiella sp. LLJ827 TaxID=2917712 RepID=UPI002100A37C|nr:alpha/beta hydrolase [Jiella sp. LLJ827]MCQ0989037.1 alpha/beta hydrolase [Jiella sp. LLJ827]